MSLLPVVVPEAREPGPGAKRVRLHGARLFVLPNPSGLNAAYPGFGITPPHMARPDSRNSR